MRILRFALNCTNAVFTKPAYRVPASGSLAPSEPTAKPRQRQYQRKMVTDDEQIRVSDRVKKEPDRRWREGKSCNDVLERVLDEVRVGDFDK